MINCIVVDDEPLALALLEDHIRKVPELQLRLSTTDPLAGIKMVQDKSADLLFLDIRMPQLNGLDVLRIIGHKCQVVVTSAFPEYAIHGFEHHTADYLLKPVSFPRFLTAIARVKERLSKTTTLENFVYLKVEQRMQRINFNEVLYVEGSKDYVQIRLLHNKIITLQTLKAMEELLPPDQFIRVHKSFIVAINKIEQIHKQHIVINQTIIPIGEFYRDQFLKQALKG